MVSINWCLKQKEGIKLVEPNENISEAYLKKSEEALGTMIRERKYNLTFSISACYYSMYYSLYSVLMKLGIKCEIHICTIEFMKKFLLDFYSEEELKIIKKAFNLRNISQYYVDKIIDEKEIDFLIIMAPVFFNKTKEILSRINQKDIKRIKEELFK